MNTEEKAQELYPNNKTFCGGVAQIARDAFAKGARMQKEVDDKELSEKVSAAYQLGLADKEKQMMKEARNHFVLRVLSDNTIKKMIELYNDEVDCKFGDRVRIIIIKEEKNGTE